MSDETTTSSWNQPFPEAPVEAPPSPKLSRYERREQASADALRGLIRDFLMEKYPALMESKQALNLSIDLVLEPGEPGGLRFTPDLRKQVSEQAMALLAPRDAYEEGAVYDFQQESARGPGCRPAEGDQVFGGYDNLGRPVWKTLTQVLLDAQDPRVDALTGRVGRAVALVQLGKELRCQQLSSHGRSNKGYSLLGQVVCGYYGLPPAYVKLAGGAKLAVSLHVVETRDARGQFALRMNTVAGGFLAQEFEDLLKEPALRGLAMAREAMRTKVADLESRGREALIRRDSEAFQKAMRRIPGLLRDFAEAVENPGAGVRPPVDPRVWKEDVAEARPDEVFYDNHRHSWVVLGTRNRAHAFSQEGVYLTTFHAPAAVLEQRILSGRWQVEHPERSALLGRLV